MMVELTYQMMLSTIQTAGIIAGIAYYTMILNYTRRNQEQTLKTRKITLFQQTIGSIMTSSLGIKSIAILNQNQPTIFQEHIELTKKYPEYLEAWLWIINTLDIAGIYLKEEAFDIELISKYNPWWFLNFWKRSEPIIDEWRKVYGPSYLAYIDYFINALKKNTVEKIEHAP